MSTPEILYGRYPAGSNLKFLVQMCGSFYLTSCFHFTARLVQNCCGLAPVRQLNASRCPFLVRLSNVFFPTSTSNATIKFLAQLQHISKARHRGASSAPSSANPAFFCCSWRVDGTPALCARCTRCRTAARRGKPGFGVATVRCFVDAHQASGVPGSGSESALCLDRAANAPSVPY